MLKLRSLKLSKTKVDTLLIAVCEDADLFKRKDINRLITHAEKIGKFSGKETESITLLMVSLTNL